MSTTDAPPECQYFCERLYEGQMINCCVPESINLHKCRDNADCLGARVCDDVSGVCKGISGCDNTDKDEKQRTGLKVIYDIECVCLGISNTCLFPDGIPCEQNCRYVREGESASCTINITNLG